MKYGPTILLSAVLSIMLINGCEREVDNIQFVKSFDSFTVSLANDTKVHIENISDIRWDIGDVIAVFSDLQGPSVFTREADGVFRGDKVSGTVFYSYPIYSLRFFGDIINSVHYDANNPSILTCDQLNGWINSEIAIIPMIAISSDNQLLFKQVCGIMHFRMKGRNTLSSVFLYGNQNEQIGGPGYLDLTASSPVFLKLSEESAVDNVVAKCPNIQRDAEYWDCYFLLPPLSLQGGFHIQINCINKETGEAFHLSKVSNKAISISRGEMLSFPIIDIDSEYESVYIRERETLISLFNATEGNNWINNANWCTETPVGEWYGIGTDSDGHVVSISFGNNNLCGTLPPEIWSLPYLRRLKINNNRLSIQIPEVEDGLSNSIEFLDLSNYDVSGMVGDDSLDMPEKGNTLMGGIPSSVSKLTHLTELYAAKVGITGIIPDELWQPSLKAVFLPENHLEGGITHAINNAKSLEQLILSNNLLSGSIPDELCELENLRILDISNASENLITGIITTCNHFTSLPTNIGDLSCLSQLIACGNAFRGPIPSSLFKCTNLSRLELGSTWNYAGYYNDFNSIIPEEIGDLVNLEYLGLYGAGIKGHIPQSFNRLDKLNACKLGSIYDSDESHNELYGSLPDITGMNNLRVLDFDNNYLEGNIPIHYADIPELTLFAQYNCLSGDLPDQILKSKNFSNWSITPQREGYGLSVGSLYESSDYSRDGRVIQIQKATEGEGINVVFIGDAFADYEIANGKYDSIIREGIEQFFDIEPYSSFRNMFNVYEVEVVSKNNTYLGSFHSIDTALETGYGEGTFVYGNDQRCLDYAAQAVGDIENNWKELLIIVLINREYYAGTCFMYHLDEHDNTGVDYGNGLSIAYLPLGTDPDMFRGLVQHEAGGHGFAKLADEYSYDSGGFFDEDFYNSVVNINWYPNIDLTSTPSKIKWKEFLNESYYIDEGVGIFEGGATIPTGIWRPTENSIMRYNTGEYNAPSRQAIWKRINKLSFGNDWEYRHEDFVNYDQMVRANGFPSKQSKKIPSSLLRRYPPLSPPVVRTVGKDYFNEMQNKAKRKGQAVESTNYSADEIESAYSIGNTHYTVKGNMVKSYTVAPE